MKLSYRIISFGQGGRTLTTTADDFLC